MEREELAEQLTNAELEKMLLEIEDLKHKCSRMQRRLGYLPLISALVTIGTLWIGIFTLQMNYEAQSKAERDKANQESQQELQRMQQAKDAFRTPFMEKHLDVYFETIGVVSRIGLTAVGSPERKREENHFKQLFRGPLALVEDGNLNEWIVAFADCLEGVVDPCTGSDVDKELQLQQTGYEFIKSARAHLFRKWGVDLNESGNSGDAPMASKMKFVPK